MKTKLAVHWAPWVYIIVPGWILAVAAGAHCGAACAGAVVTAAAPSSALATTATTATARRSMGWFIGLLTRIGPRGSLGTFTVPNERGPDGVTRE